MKVHEPLCVVCCMVLVGKFVVVHGAPREQPTFNLMKSLTHFIGSQVKFFMRPHSKARVSSQFIQVDGTLETGSMVLHRAALLHDKL